MPGSGNKLPALAILFIVLSGLLLAVLPGVSEAAKATPTPKATPKQPSTPSTQICVITGRVTDSHGNGVGGAKVTLYNMTYQNGKPVDTGLTTVIPNPQYTTSGGNNANVGYYQFSGVPAGTYDIVVEYGGYLYPKIIVATGGGTLTFDFVADPGTDNVAHTSATPAPVPTTGQEVTVTAGPIVTTIPADSTPGDEQETGQPPFLRIGVAALIILQFLAACLVLGLYLTGRI